MNNQVAVANNVLSPNYLKCLLTEREMKTLLEPDKNDSTTTTFSNSIGGNTNITTAMADGSASNHTILYSDDDNKNKHSGNAIRKGKDSGKDNVPELCRDISQVIDDLHGDGWVATGLVSGKMLKTYKKNANSTTTPTTTSPYNGAKYIYYYPHNQRATTCPLPSSNSYSYGVGSSNSGLDYKESSWGFGNGNGSGSFWRHGRKFNYDNYSDYNTNDNGRVSNGSFTPSSSGSGRGSDGAPMIISSLASFEKLSEKTRRSKSSIPKSVSTAPSTPSTDSYHYQHFINHSYLNGKKLSKSSKHYRSVPNRSVPKKNNNIVNTKATPSPASGTFNGSGINNRRAKMHIRLNNNIINNIIMKNINNDLISTSDTMTYGAPNADTGGQNFTNSEEENIRGQSEDSDRDDDNYIYNDNGDDVKVDDNAMF